MNNDILDRLLQFAINVILFLRKKTEEYLVIKRQLIKSSTSSGTNYEEALRGSRRADFTNKVRISLKEIRACNYWLKAINGTQTQEELKSECQILFKESLELKKI
ncbi:MAG TPA: four helix bundle protein [Bacteroidia bacterium]|nr:four helix bundle protein [Bacteroidia bacterium]